MAATAFKSAGKRIVFTGGSGKAGRHVIPELLKRGHQVDSVWNVPQQFLSIWFLIEKDDLLSTTHRSST